MSNELFIQPSVLSWAVHESQVDHDTLFARFPNLRSWLNAEKYPTFSQLKALSSYLKVPFGYLFLQEPPAEPTIIREFRTVDNQRLNHISKNLQDTLLHMQAIADWMNEYRRLDLGDTPLKFIGASEGITDVNQLSNAFLRILDLETGFSTEYRSPETLLKSLRDKMEGQGVLIFVRSMVGNNAHRPLDVDEFRAFCIADHYAPVVFLNGKDSHYGKVFSLIHEFLHLMLGKNGVTSTSIDETICNRVTVNLLVPLKKLIPMLPKRAFNADDISHLATIFNVSRLALAFLLFRMNYISSSLLDSIRTQTASDVNAKQKRKDAGGPNFHVVYDANVSQAFRRALAYQWSQGDTSYAQAGQLLGVSKPETISQILMRAT